MQHPKEAVDRAIALSAQLSNLKSSPNPDSSEVERLTKERNEAHETARTQVIGYKDGNYTNLRRETDLAVLDVPDSAVGDRP